MNSRAASKPRRPEIMAPAGDFASLSAALKAGADAVYFGVRGFNMRAGAKNFSTAQLPRIVAECRKKGARAYITLNTIFYESELSKLESLVKAAKAAGVDAAIAWDFSVIERAKRAGLEVFLSTQASVSNSAAIAEYFRKFAIRRYVLARECSLADIPKIRRGLKRELGKDAEKISLEVFAHGAMCVSESGRCFMSGFTCGKSANRGTCAQPCRREYRILSDDGSEFVVGDGYVLSPKDLCVIPFVEKLFAAGVDSLKIEGRNRNPEYVYAAVRAYVGLRDFYFKNRREKNFNEEFGALKSACMKDVSRVFNRGFSDGFYMGKPFGDWTSRGNAATAKKTIVGHVVRVYPKISVAEISIDVGRVRIGDTIQIEGERTGFVEMKIGGIQVDGLAAETARRGERACVKVPELPRKSDRVYRLVPVTAENS